MTALLIPLGLVLLVPVLAFLGGLLFPVAEILIDGAASLGSTCGEWLASKLRGGGIA